MMLLLLLLIQALQRLVLSGAQSVCGWQEAGLNAEHRGLQGHRWVPG